MLYNNLNQTIIGVNTDATYRISWLYGRSNSVDGYSIAPTDFGEFDDDSGIWKPKDIQVLHGTRFLFRL